MITKSAPASLRPCSRVLDALSFPSLGRTPDARESWDNFSIIQFRQILLSRQPAGFTANKVKQPQPKIACRAEENQPTADIINFSDVPSNADNISLTIISWECWVPFSQSKETSRWQARLLPSRLPCGSGWDQNNQLCFRFHKWFKADKQH